MIERASRSNLILTVLTIILILPGSIQVQSEGPAGSGQGERAVFSGGQLEWSVQLEGENGYFLSTPELVDLNNDGDLEIVIASSSGNLHALCPDGQRYWMDPFPDWDTEMVGERNWSRPENITSPTFFSPPAAYDLIHGDTPELIVGGREGVYCVGADGERRWKYHIENSSVFCPVTITDLEGEFNGSKENMEIVFIADHHNGTSSLICLDNTGNENFKIWLGEGYFNIGGAVAASDLDGDLLRNNTPRSPDPSNERNLEMIFSGRGSALNIIGMGYNSTTGGYSPYLSSSKIGSNISTSTPCIGDLDDDNEMEMVILCNTGNTTEDCEGERSTHDPDGDLLWSHASHGRGTGYFSSPISADLENLIWEPGDTYSPEIVLAGYDGILRVLSTNGSLLWDLDTGSPILSSPAICDIYDDQKGQIVIATSSGKVFMVDGDPSDGIDEGVPYPGDGPTQDVLWVYATYTNITSSSPVIADIDLDGQLEVLIGDDEGMIYCISAGGATYKGSMDWPTYQGNLNRTGQRSVYLSFGVDIYPSSGISDSLVKPVQPGQIATYNLTVENTGTGISILNRDKISIDIEPGSVPTGWKAWLDTPEHQGNPNPGYVPLASEEIADIALYVEAPWDDSKGDHARIRVIATSGFDPIVNDSLEVMAVLDLHADFDLFYLKQVDTDPLSDYYGNKWDKINPGAEGLYTISINNKGNVNDSYELSLFGPPEDSGWDWFFMESGNRTVSCDLTAPTIADRFGDISGMTFTVFVECPEDARAGMNQSVILKGRSLSDSLLWKEDRLIMYPRAVREITMEVNNTEIRIDPRQKEPVSFDLLLTNSGNTDVVNILLTFECGLSGWGVKYPEEPIAVIYHSTIFVPIKMRPLSHTLEPGIIPVTFIAMVEGIRSLHNVTVNLTVLEYYSVTASQIEPVPVNLTPGSHNSTSINIHNYGNTEENIGLEIVNDNMDIRCNLQGIGDVMPLRPFEDEQLVIRLEADELALAGIRTIYLNITLEHAVPFLVTVLVNVVQIYDLDLTYESGGMEASLVMEQGSNRSLTMVLTNKGNGFESIMMGTFQGPFLDNDRLVLLPDGWEALFIGISKDGSFDGERLTLRTDEMIASTSLMEYVHYLLYEPYGRASGSRFLKMMIGPMETISIKMMVRSPDRMGEEMVDGISVLVHLSSKHNEEDIHLSAHIFVQYPDLAFSGTPTIYGADKVMIGDSTEVGQVFVQVKVINIGQIGSHPFLLTIHINGIGAGSAEIPSLDAGMEYEVLVEVNITSGENRIEIEIDPYNNVYEYKDQFMEGGMYDDNRHVITIEGRMRDRDMRGFNIMIALWIMLLVFLLILALVVIRRRRDIQAHEE